MKEMAPVVLFAFNRPDHLQQTLKALEANVGAEQTEVIAYCDGPRHEKDLTQVSEVRNVLSRKYRFKKLEIIPSEKNRGLANSLIAGITETLNHFPSVVVLEDDLVTAPYFLKFMNDGLKLYENEPDVCSIHGYSYPLKGNLPETYFLKGGDCWGWATWRRAWKEFNPDGQALLDSLMTLDQAFEFDVYGTYGYIDMLRGQIAGKYSSWAIRWRAATFLKGMLTLYPRHSLVKNIGFDNTGTHSDASSTYAVELYNQPIQLQKQTIEQNKKALLALSNFYLEAAPNWKLPLKKIRRDLRRLDGKHLFRYWP